MDLFQCFILRCAKWLVFSQLNVEVAPNHFKTQFLVFMPNLYDDPKVYHERFQVILVQSSQYEATKYMLISCSLQEPR